MKRSPLAIALCALLCGVAAAFVWGSAAASAAQDAATAKPKTILLGFDGVDPELTERWMAEGHLPNLRRLAEQGSYSSFGTANPAQSPVSWAVLETASNPGKTNIGDFVRRTTTTEIPGAILAGVSPDEVPIAEVPARMPGMSKVEAFVFSLGDPVRGRLVLFVFAGATLLVVFLLFKVVFRLRFLGALLVALLFAGAAGYAVQVARDSLPRKLVIPVNEMQGERFWNVLAREGVRFTGLQVPSVFPCHAEPGVKLLGGLFVPDVQGGPGSWGIYTNDVWAMGASTETGGKIFKIYEDPDGIARTTLSGPKNFPKEMELKEAIAQLERALAEKGRADDDTKRLEKELAQARNRKKLFDNNERYVSVPFEIAPDYDARTARITIDGETQTVPENGWSDYFRVTFRMNRLLKVEGVARVHVKSCSRDAKGTQLLELFVPPISISPEWQPPILPISWPRDFAAEIAQDIGLYDTIGWACWTNALKDTQIAEQTFMDSLDFTLTWRTRQLERELARDDWDVLFHVESVTDRAGHMLFRFLDEEHPQYDAEAAGGGYLRDMDVKAYGRTFPLKHGIRETYREMDRIVGSVMERLEKGEFGPGARLFVVSDHGFEPFRYGVNLNVWLQEHGYLVVKGQPDDGVLQSGDDTGGEVSVGGLIDGSGAGNFAYVDWTRTRAYAIGLGKIYVNLKGREKSGIVEPAAMDALVREINQKLEATLDAKRDGARVVIRAYAATDIYTGPYVDNAGDIVLGFAKGYRSSWQSTLGGFEKDGLGNGGIVGNDQPWTGDHCGVDPSLVQGIFFANRKLAPGQAPDLLHIAPTICATYGVPTPAEWDGKKLEFAD